MPTPSTISVWVERARFDRVAGELARAGECSLLLSDDGYPARTASLVGLDPTAELILTEATTPDRVKRFCFGTPGPALGFVSYDYGMLLRGVDSGKPRDFPLGVLRKFGAVMEYADGRATVSGADPERVRRLARSLGQARPAGSPPMPAAPDSTPAFSLDRAGYEAGVAATLERILAGDTYQLNLSTRISRHCPGLDPLGLFLALRHRYPAPFYAWLASGSKRVVSASPERFLRVEDGAVLSQPIKGTRRAGDDPARNAARLKGSAKESAELSMIVDLIRNDISAHCEYGSVRVENHKSVFLVDDLLQMYSDVRGRLRNDRDCLDLFFDAFPGGSVTGCPKRRSMEIIEALEPHARGVYCGSVLVVRDERNMDSSVAIRTAAFDTGSEILDVFAGSGIVVDSDPAREYLETMAKAGKFLFREQP